MVAFKLLTAKPIVAGGTLNGKLIVEAKKDTKAKELDVKFLGEEKIQIAHAVSTGEFVMEETKKQTKQLIHEDVLMHDVNRIINGNFGLLPAWTYEYAFQIPLPSELPAIIVVPKIFRPDTQKVRGPLDVSKGEVTAGAHTDDTILIPGQQITLDLGIVNDSKATIKEITVTLVERVDVAYPNFGNPKYTKEITKDLTVSEVAVDDTYCAKKGSKELKEEKKDPLKSERNYQLVAEQLSSGNHLVTLPPVPEDASDSYRYASDLLKVSHEIDVRFQTKTFTSNPGFRLPVAIRRGRAAESVDASDLPVALAEAISDLDTIDESVPTAIATPINSSKGGLEYR
ncbi:unknown protein [Seminavis robusta]|uniref:Arrestin C-terminal-like domain-containing protein n=1 Tax=Seminavis robusta TaxID=568900 RepID=A0A9N8EKY6_9STRA|nr:unknown protein [Seminavis robusta]|eukprot:Sro1152_g246830.1 n/a (342) ;mRNA; f:4466-5622